MGFEVSQIRAHAQNSDQRSQGFSRFVGPHDPLGATPAKQKISGLPWLVSWKVWASSLSSVTLVHASDHLEIRSPSWVSEDSPSSVPVACASLLA